MSIRHSIDGGVASVVIDNPRQRNAITRAMCLELQELFPAIDADPAVLVMTLSGTNGTFSAGAAITELGSILLDRSPDGDRVDQLTLADDALTSMTKPTIALVDGPCIGGGWQIASACDFIVASERSVFGITPAKLGVIYPRPGIERLVRQVGPATAKYILFGGETFTATRAAELGLVAEVVADAAFEERCRALVTGMLQRSQFSIHELKQLVELTVGADAGLDEAWDAAWLATEAGPDMEIGTTAFLAREQPKFSWKA